MISYYENLGWINDILGNFEKADEYYGLADALASNSELSDE